MRCVLHGSARRVPSVTKAAAEFCVFYEEGEERVNRTPGGGGIFPVRGGGESSFVPCGAPLGGPGGCAGGDSYNHDAPKRGNPSQTGFAIVHRFRLAERLTFPGLKGETRGTRLGGLEHEAFSEGAQGIVDAVDFGGVADVGEAVDLLGRGADAAGEFGGAHVLAEHFIQQENFRGEAGG